MNRNKEDNEISFIYKINNNYILIFSQFLPLSNILIIPL